jgi:hypothetical protein
VEGVGSEEQGWADERLHTADEKIQRLESDLRDTQSEKTTHCLLTVREEVMVAGAEEATRGAKGNDGRTGVATTQKSRPNANQSVLCRFSRTSAPSITG